MHVVTYKTATKNQHKRCALLTSSAIREKERFLYGRFKQAENIEVKVKAVVPHSQPAKAG
ncbi:hypothetical protein T4B_2544 [Trichinella pseudospiralis]|uniref:Uncharacterized protein n=1 Tax=Trichinella pseudospiralis TaxID=6337 RepID=A0A0V1IHD0_TRIPS|nr:hypothetical protein T4B_2544 [Trichinella pseudospiralis]KRZ34863.1 hypothetical protein T4C_7562 [Trichinella pseudospiralis]